ncbi:MAG: aminotransferase class V-fold PLP-dependent enzyme [Thermoanaerobaculia bacterium]|nr:aminotransferase class V-fold PLP-dependent enzyme [Thermoanaerobaculia bacterium]
MEPELKRAAELAAEYLAGLDSGRIGDEATPESLRERLGRPLTEHGVPGTQVVEELAEDVREGLLNTASGRFFGWVIGGGLPAAVAADWLTSVWDQNAAGFACSPAASVVEEIVGTWVKELLGLPAEASFALVTGCQMAHVTALAAARHRLLSDRGIDVERDGLFGAPPIRVLAGEHHETLLRALRLIGIGTGAVVKVAQEDGGPIDLEALEALLEKDAQVPTVVALAAGDLNRGAYDRLGEACDIAHRHGAWVHVDGAFGLWAAASPRFRHLVNGVERADSWATDAHKWLNVPYDSGLAFVRDREAHRAAMSISAAYKVEVPTGRDPFDWGPEWSRRARGFALYAALRTMGRHGVAGVVERCCDLTEKLVDGLRALPGVEVLAPPIINQALVRFRAGDGDHDARTDEVIQRLNAGGVAWFGPTTWGGVRVMRISVSNFRTTTEDIDRVLRAFAEILDE